MTSTRSAALATLASPDVAQFPRYVQEHSHWLIEVPVRIAVVIVVAMIVRLIALRAIDRLVRPRRSGELPRILQPFKEKVDLGGMFDSAGRLSERREQRAKTIGSVMKSAASFAIFLLTVMTVLYELSINLAPFIAGTSVVGVALGFGAQSIVKDFLSGMFMMVEDQYGVGDVIDFQLASGVVEGVGLRTTRLRDENGTVWYVRNGEVLRVGNSSQGFSRLIVDVPVPATADLDATAAALLEEARRMQAEEQWSPIFLSPPELEGVQSLAVDQAALRLVAKVCPGQQFRSGRELRRRIRERLDKLAAGAATDPAAIEPASASAQSSS